LHEIVPGTMTECTGRSHTKHDVYCAQYKECEQFGSDNPRHCGTGAGRSVDKWVNSATMSHPLTWVDIGYHPIARDEDQQPVPVHRQGFQLVPRDVAAMNPLTPHGLEGQKVITSREVEQEACASGCTASRSRSTLP
jgi:primary-amine oxidase